MILSSGGGYFIEEGCRGNFTILQFCNHAQIRASVGALALRSELCALCYPGNGLQIRASGVPLSNA